MGTPVISPLPMVVTRAPPLREIPTAEVTCSDECIVDGESPRAWATCPRPRQSRDSSVFVRWSHVVARRYATASSKPRGSTGRSPSTRVASCPLPAAVDPDRGPRPCAAPGLHVRRVRAAAGRDDGFLPRPLSDPGRHRSAQRTGSPGPKGSGGLEERAVALGAGQARRRRRVARRTRPPTPSRPRPTASSGSVLAPVNGRPVAVARTRSVASTPKLPPPQRPVIP